MKLKKKVISLFLGVALVPLIIGGMFNVWYTEGEIETMVTNQLSSINDLKKNQVESYFNERYSDIQVLSASDNIKKGMKAFDKAYVSGLNSEAYKQSLNQYEGYFKKYIEAYNYYDLFLVNLEGDVVYTVAKEDDLGINLNDTNYRELSLAKAFQRGKSDTVIMDYEYYEISGEYASFIVTPIYSDNQSIEGVLMLQLSSKDIEELMQNTKGLGETGEAYIVGEDLYMRSESRFSEESTIGKQLVDTTFVRKALNKEEGVEPGYDYRGQSVVSCFAPLDIKGLNWVIIAEIDMDEAFANLTHLVKLMGGMFVTLVGVISVLAYLVGKSLTKPIIQLQERANDIATFDLRQEIEPEFLARQDEVGDLARALNEIIASFKEIIITITESSKNVTGASQELTSMLEEYSASGEEVAKAVSEIAEGAVSQAVRTDEGQQKAVELGKHIEEDATYMKALNVATQNMGVAVNEGLELMNTLIQISNESDAQAKAIQRDILLTDESAKKIEEVSKVIAAISEQTNLLALNASIEAARAGEAGKGFTVVAEEIRKLAEQSSKSIETINTIVLELQNNSKKAVEQMASVIDTLEEERKGIQMSSHKYQSIQEEVCKSENVVAALNESASQMEYAKNNILEAFKSLAAVAEGNSTSTEEVSASTQEQAVGIGEMTNTSIQLSQLAVEMQEVISKFKID